MMMIVKIYLYHRMIFLPINGRLPYDLTCNLKQFKPVLHHNHHHHQSFDQSLSTEDQK